MPKYVHKPVEIDALQWDDNWREMREFLQYEDEQQALVLVPCTQIGEALSFYCLRLDLFCTIFPGDAVIALPDGFGFFPCMAAQFAAYEPVVEA